MSYPSGIAWIGMIGRFTEPTSEIKLLHRTTRDGAIHDILHYLGVRSHRKIEVSRSCPIVEPWADLAEALEEDVWLPVAVSIIEVVEFRDIVRRRQSIERQSPHRSGSIGRVDFFILCVVWLLPLHKVHTGKQARHEQGNGYAHGPRERSGVVAL